MATRNTRQLGPFLGIVYALDPENIPDGAAADMRNVTVEDGRIRPRYGFRRLSAPQTGMSGVYGFDLVHGLGAGNEPVEEYLSFENVGAGIRPFSVDPSTGARTAITQSGVAPTALTLPAWGLQPGIRSFSFNNFSYSVSPSETTRPSVYKHAVGATSSWIPMQAPANPTRPALVVPYLTQKDDGSQKTMPWDDGTPLNKAAVTVTGSNLYPNAGSGHDPTSNGGGTLLIYHNNIGGSTDVHPESVEVDLSDTAHHAPGIQDWTFVDRIAIPIFTSMMFDITSIGVTLTTNAGAVFQPDLIQVLGPTPTGTVGEAPSNYYTVVCDFKYKSPRSDWSQIKKIKIGWTEYGGNDTDPQAIQISPIQLGNVDCTPYDDSGAATNLVLAYTYYSSSTGLESGMSPATVLTPTQIGGQKIADPWRSGTYYLYTRLKMYLLKDTGAGYDTLFDSYRIYARRTGDPTWRQIDTFTAATSQGPAGASAHGGLTHGGTTYDTTYDYQVRWSDALLDPTLSPGTNVFGGVVCATPFSGWMVWGFKGGYQNIRHSAIGSAETLFDNADSTLLDPGNVGAPANFTLADDAADDPVAMFQCGPSLIVLGSNGVYASHGTTPSTMTPFMRLPTALGCAGQFACCRWHDVLGNPAVAFLSRNGEGIYLAQPDPYFLNTVHYKVSELTLPVRGLVDSFLIDGQGLSNLSSVRMGVDENRDALWVLAGTRAMVYRRPSLADAERHWELYDYTLASGTIGFTSFTTKWRMRWLRTSGDIDEVEFDSATGTFISGPLGDAGLAPGAITFTTKKFVGPNRRIDRVRVDRENLADTPTLTDFCTRTPSGESVTVGAGRYQFRFGAMAQGEEHQFQLSLPDGAGYVRRIEFDEIGPLGRRTKS